MSTNILVIAETRDGAIKGITKEAITCAVDVAGQLGGEVVGRGEALFRVLLQAAVEEKLPARECLGQGRALARGHALQDRVRRVEIIGVQDTDHLARRFP